MPPLLISIFLRRRTSANVGACARVRACVMFGGPQVRTLLKNLDEARVHAGYSGHKAPPGFADQVLFESIDTDGSGDIDRVEWVTFIAKQARTYGERPMFNLMQTLRKEMDEKWSLPC